MNNPLYTELTIYEKKEFIGCLVIAAENDFFSECWELVLLAKRSGLYERIKPLPDNNKDALNDLNNPIENM